MNKANPPDELSEAHTLLRTGNRVQAQLLCRAILARQPDSHDALRLLGKLLTQTGKCGEAVPLLRRAIALSGAEAEPHLHLAQALIGLGCDEDAITVLVAALRGRAVHVPMTILLASALHRGGWVEAAGTLLGDTLFRVGAAPAAMELLEHWQSLMPDDPVPAHRLAALRGDAPPARAADAYVRYLFDRYADKFDASLANLEYHGPALIAQLLKTSGVKPNGRWRVLDAGCGTGLCAPIVRPFAVHLTGVDLSPAMIEKATERGGYDELVIAELTDYLGRNEAQFDLIISADTLIYFGDLRAVFDQAERALRPSGYLAFTLEKEDDDAATCGYRLNANARYSHSKSYVLQTLDDSGLTVRSVDAVTVREGDGEFVYGWAVLAQRYRLEYLQ